MMQKYEHWSKVLIEPSSMNHARLYALEARVQEEENSRLSELSTMKDTLKKIIFSMEQNETTHLVSSFESPVLPYIKLKSP